MPGEFYIEGKAEKVDLTQVIEKITSETFGLEALKDLLEALGIKADHIGSQTDKLAGQTPATGSVARDWQTAEAELISIGAENAKNKLHSLLVSIHNLAGTIITVRLYMRVNGIERKVYEQSFDATADPPGLWIVNGTVGIHEALKVTLESNNAADNSRAVDYDYSLEAM
jgi:hypothetical protein